jgi:hypothetical protein
MRLLQLLILVLLATAVLNSVLLAELTVAISLDDASCFDSGTSSAQCSFVTTVSDIVVGPVQVSASGYVLSAPNSLTFEFNYDILEGCCFDPHIFDQLILLETGVINDNFRLSTPAPPGYFAFYDIPGIGANGIGGSQGGNGSDGGMLVETSGIFQADGFTIAQPVPGDFLSISASFMQTDPIVGLGLTGTLLPTTYSIELLPDICNPDTGDCIPEGFTPVVPEPASFWLLLPAAGLVVRRSKALRSIKFRRALFDR